MSGLSLVRFAIQASRIRHCFRRTLIYLFRKQSAIGSIVPGTQMQIVGSVGVDDSSTNRLGSSVAERPACDGVVPGSIPGLAFSFSSYRIEVSEPMFSDMFCQRQLDPTEMEEINKKLACQGRSLRQFKRLRM